MSEDACTYESFCDGCGELIVDGECDCDYVYSDDDEPGWDCECGYHQPDDEACGTNILDAS